MEKINNKKINEKEIKETINAFTLTPNNETSRGENLAEIIKAWFNPSFLHSKTRLNANQIIAVTTLKSIADKWKVNCITRIINNFVRYKLSEGGQSSKELVDILKSRTEINDDTDLWEKMKPFMR